MKKLLITCLALMAFVLPTIAQVDHDYNENDRDIITAFNLSRDQVPVGVIKEAKLNFALSDSSTWTKFPYALKEYGWVYDKDASDVRPDRYEVRMIQGGKDLYAVYSSEGNLIATREMSTNIVVPNSVKDALSKSKYKDWTIVGDKEVIRYYHDRNSVEQHFRVTVEKNKAKRTISFNYQATATANK